MAGRRQVKDGGSLVEDINSGEVIHDGSVLTDDRPWETWYSRYGKAIRLPADSAQTQILRLQGFTHSKPRNPRKTPTKLKLRDGSIFDLASSSGDLTQAEKNKINGATGQTSTAPTATYYSQQGDVLPNLPADPASMKAYSEMGLSITPPAKAAVSA